MTAYLEALVISLYNQVIYSSS